MANDLKFGTIRFRGTGAKPHLVQLRAQPRDADVAVEISVEGSAHQWSLTRTVDGSRWRALVEDLQRARKQYAAVAKSPFPEVGDAEVHLGELDYVTAGAASDLAHATGASVLALIGELGGPTDSVLLPERAIPMGSADDTIDDSAMRANLHDTIPDSPGIHHESD